jgi:C-terminal processing protease CtpA/Prc
MECGISHNLGGTRKPWPGDRSNCQSHFDGRLFVLIDHGSFSTTGHFLAHLRASSRAVFVGRESGGGALCADASEHLVLPHSQLRLRVATKTFLADVADAFVDGGIVPTIEVIPTVDDVVHRRDPVLARLGEILGADLAELTEAARAVPEN